MSKTIQMGLRINKRMKEKLIKLANERYIDYTELMRLMLSEGIRRRENEEMPRKSKDFPHLARDNQLNKGESIK